MAYIAPTYIQNLVSSKSKGACNLRQSGGISLASPTFRTKVTQGDMAWNTLPRELSEIPRFRTHFKSHLKTHLFKFACS